MSEGVKETAQAILSNPKVATVITASSFYQTWWVDWASPLLDIVATVGGVVLVGIMIMLQWENLKDKWRRNKDRKRRAEDKQ